MTYDVVIIGGGPGGYTAALYATRAGLSAVVVERLSAGGQLALTHRVDNYPGFENGVDGFELAFAMQKQAERFGAKTVYGEVVAVKLTAEPKEVQTATETLYGKTVMLATGANPRELGLPNERALVGKGVSYCATCDGMFFKGKTVVVVGGGDTAVADTLVLSRLAEKVILVHRRDTLRATKIYHGQLQQLDNVELKFNRVVSEILENGRVSGVKLTDTVTGEEETLACDGVFVAVGRIPATKLVEGQVDLDKSGYIVADESTKTNLPGVFAVGDVRTKTLRQVVTATADGAMAALGAEEYCNAT